MQLETTRGCFNTCTFCVSGGEKPVRTLPVERIRERLDLIQEKGYPGHPVAGPYF